MSATPPRPPRKAVYAGSFDPVTNGHLWVIETAAGLFDELVVALGVNPAKRSTFPAAVRLALLAETVTHLPNVRVSQVNHEFLVRFGANLGAGYLVRGIRGAGDFEFERTVHHVNRRLEPGIETVFLMPPKGLEELSSSFVKSMAGPVGWREVVAGFVPPGVLEQLKLHHAEERWRTFARALDLGAAAEEAAWAQLAAGYGQPGRAYHNLDHILDCLEGLDHHGAAVAADPAALAAALWFHDVEDERGDPAAVARSADAAAAVFTTPGAGMAAGFAEKVRTLILATDYARPWPPTASAASGDEELMRDLDLAILGQPPERYARYAAAIRAEYAAVPEAEFRPGRARILSGFLQGERIYRTDVFHRRLEENARANLRAEVARLLGAGDAP